MGSPETHDGADTYLVSKKFSDSLSLSLGKGSFKVGGLENDDGGDVNLSNEYGNNHHLGSGTLVQVDYGMGNNTFTLQLGDDVVATSLASDGSCPEVARNCARYNTANKQPAIFLQYAGKFGMIEPLVQINSYDSGHSMETALGVKFATGAASGYVDYVMNNVGYKTGGKEYTDKLAAISLYAQYEMGKLTPNFKYVSYDVTQDGTDLSGNTSRSAFDDNHSAVALGVGYAMADNFTTYFELTNSSQTVTESGKDESLSQMVVTIGAKGSI